MSANAAEAQSELIMAVEQINRIRQQQVNQINNSLQVQSKVLKDEYDELINDFYHHNQFSLLSKIDLLNLLFEINLKKYKLPKALTQQYELLKPTTLVLALNDEHFFLEDTNPIAFFINQSAQVISQKLEHSNELIFQELLMRSVESLIKKLSLQNTDVLTETTALLSNLKTKKTDHIKITHSFDDDASKSSKQAIHQVIQNQPISEDINGFLTQTWSEVLASIAREEGEKSKNWHQALKVATLIVWSVNANRVIKDYPKFLKSLPIIFSSIAEGLKKTRAYDQYYSEFSSILTVEHAQIIAQIEHQLSKVKQSLKSSLKTSDDSRTRNISSKLTHSITNLAKQHIDSAKQLKKGDWLEMRAGAVPVRIKLIWKSGDNSEYIFVNQAGEKVKECNLMTLASDLEKGVIQTITSNRSIKATHNSVLKTIG